MDFSIFMDRQKTPCAKDLVEPLGKTFPWWEEIREYVHEKYPKAEDLWSYPGAKYGWGFRVKDKKRAIIYLGPRKGHFMAAFVFGQKATREIMKSKLPEPIKNELAAAKVYAEGRGLRMKVSNKAVVKDIKKLIDIKLEN